MPPSTCCSTCQCCVGIPCWPLCVTGLLYYIAIFTFHKTVASVSVRARVLSHAPSPPASAVRPLPWSPLSSGSTTSDGSPRPIPAIDVPMLLVGSCRVLTPQTFIELIVDEVTELVTRTLLVNRLTTEVVELDRAMVCTYICTQLCHQLISIGWGSDNGGVDLRANS